MYDEGGGISMTQKDLLKNEKTINDEKSVGYYAVKYTVFLAPPAGIFLVFYCLLHDLIWSAIGTAITVILGVVVIAYLYMKRLGGVYTLDE